MEQGTGRRGSGTLCFLVLGVHSAPRHTPAAPAAPSSPQSMAAPPFGALPAKDSLSHQDENPGRRTAWQH